MKCSFTFIVALFVSLLAIQVKAQTQRNCSANEVRERLLAENPWLAEAWEEIEHQTAHFIASGAAEQSRAVITIPTVYHVVYRTSTENITDSQIASQMTVLNADFRKLNADWTNTPSVFQSYVADCEIEFCMAQRDPTNNATTGITRKYVNKTSWGTNDDVKKSSKGGVDPWSAANYLNIWVCNIGGGILGYAQFPGGPSSTDGVVIDYRYLGTEGTATYPFNKGRTATHEVGHWLNLYHIWGDATCGSDLVSDTPTHNTANYGCPTYPHYSTCSGSPVEMTMNFMDYTDDACMYMFSTGQKNRMRAVLESGGYRYSLQSSQGCVPVGGGGSCGTPTGLNTTGITNTSATCNWTAVSGGSTYNLQWKLNSGSTWTTVSGITSTTYTLSGLTAGTTYNYQVQAVCSGTSGTYSSPVSFTTTGGSCTDTYENNNTKTKAKSIAANTTINAKIGTNTDVDWFKFSNTSSQKHIKVTLTNLPADYDMQLVSSSGTVLATSENEGTTDEQIIYNNGSVKTYYIKIYGWNGAYSNTACYALTPSISSSTWRTSGEIEEMKPAALPVLTELSVSPNPVSNGQVNVNVQLLETEINATIDIIDLTGRALVSQRQLLTKGNSKITMDVSHLPAGIYMVRVADGTTSRMTRLVVSQ
jgi:hypothetical protein